MILLYFSKYNMILPFSEEKNNFIILNLLSGSSDIASKDEVNKLYDIKSGIDVYDIDFLDYVIDRGYVYEEKEHEDLRVSEAYEEFNEIMEESPTQILLVPTYGCNFSCIYCYERGIPTKKDLITKEVADAFFDDINERFKGEKVKPYITLFGGEPFIDTDVQKDIINYIIEKSKLYGYEIAAVTNGYNVLEYIDILKKGYVKEIQVTLDGPKEIHNKRRRLLGGGDSFERILLGIDSLIENDMPVNLRVVVDKDNYSYLPELAEILDKKGHLDLDGTKFKTQIGRNYELFECSLNHQSLMTQVEQWATFVELSKKYPILRKFHKPDFKGMRNILVSGTMYSPTFDTCPAGKKEWLYDLYGDIYGCTASCGRKDYRLGTFYPERRIFDDKVLPWKERNVLNIPQCKECPVSLVCGGGCGVVANERNGSVLSPDCRDIKKLYELGVEYYKDEALIQD
ncbi:MAG: radical SAM protein [Thermoanaerobacterium sp.]|nr:radical SAM protein [Thermoanaerobacterium sp.]